MKTQKLHKEIFCETMTEEDIESERLGRELVDAIKGRKGTYVPYDPITQTLTKPLEWDDEMWKGFVFGYDEDSDQ
jgi:hypothetical protein